MSFVATGPGPRINVKVPKDLLNMSDFEDRLEVALYEVAVEAHDFWDAEAGRRLNSSREKYQDSITVKHFGNEITLELNGAFAYAIEMGANAYSMRPGFLASQKIKAVPPKIKIPRAVAATMNRTGQAAAGRYMRIPITDGKGGPPKFRMFTDTQPSTMWMHPGFKQGMRIHEDVYKEIEDRILPEAIDRLIDDLMG